MMFWRLSSDAGSMFYLDGYQPAWACLTFKRTAVTADNNGTGLSYYYCTVCRLSSDAGSMAGVFAFSTNLLY